MSALEPILKVLEKHERKLEGVETLRSELGALRRELKTEKRLADDRHETVCLKLDRIETLIVALSMGAPLKATNGTGGDHER